MFKFWELLGFWLHQLINLIVYFDDSDMLTLCILKGFATGYGATNYGIVHCIYCENRLKVPAKIEYLFLKIIIVLANSVELDPDEMLYFAAFCPGLQCLPKCIRLGVSSIQWVHTYTYATSWTLLCACCMVR